MEVVGACPDVEKNQRPEMDDGELVGINWTVGLFGNEIVHHSQETGREEKPHSVVAVPPLHHCALDPRE